MNQPSQTVNAACNSLVISAAKACLVYGSFVNGTGQTVTMVLHDAPAVPSLGSYAGQQAIVSPPIPAGGTWSPTQVGSTLAPVFNYGISFAAYPMTGPAGLQNPNFGALVSPASVAVTAWAAPLQ